MKQLLILPIIIVLFSCGNQNKVKVKKDVKEKVGTIVLVMAKTQPEYSREEIINLSKAIDPMVDEFEGYLGRKMVFANNEPDLMADIVYYTNEEAFNKATEIEMKSETCHKFFATLKEDPETTKMLVTTPVILTTPKKGDVKSVELALFKINSRYTKEEVVKAAEAINPILNQFEGFISRKLSITEDGQWMDVLYWRDVKNAEIAFQEITKNKICQSFFKMIDDTTSEFIRFNVVIDTER